MKKYYVYFYYGENDELLYVGKAVDVGKRWQSHSEEWKSEVCKIGVREYPDHASMDIFEHYYITKLPTKYNKGLLYHGKTTVDINDPTTMTVYNIEDFKKKYMPPKTTKRQQTKRILYATIDEEYTAKGYKIIYTNKVNFFNKSLWVNDLSKTLFRFKDVYVHIYQANDKKETTPTANQKVEALYKLLNNTISLTENHVIAKTDGDFFTIEDAYNAFRCNVDLEYVRKYKNRKKPGTSCFTNIFSGMISWEENEKYYMKLGFYHYGMERFSITLDKNNFIVDLESIYAREIKEQTESPF